MAETGADVGFAFDGDGDRMLAIDRSGRVHDGDELIGLIAHHLKEQGELGGGIAVTVMSNYGFHQAMEEAGIETATTAVGDRYVLEALRERGWTLGGEQAGHIIWSDYVATGDGIGAALLTMRALGGRDLAEAIPFEKLPQKLDGIETDKRDRLDEATELKAAIEKESATLEGRGRVLVRPSGTEPLVRIMVEAPTEEECSEILGRLMEIARTELEQAAICNGPITAGRGSAPGTIAAVHSLISGRRSSSVLPSSIAALTLGTTSESKRSFSSRLMMSGRRSAASESSASMRPRSSSL